MNFTSILVFLATTLSAAGCASSPLQDYMEEHEYVAFPVPRTTHGPGTIVDFEDGFESLVASPYPPFEHCMVESKVPRSEYSVALRTRTYTLTEDNALELALTKVIERPIDLRAAYEHQRIESVEIELIEPFEIQITRHSVNAYYRALSAGDPCRAHFTSSNNYVINAVIGAKKVRYRFLDAHQRGITLDGKLLESLGFSADLRTDYDGRDTLDIDRPVLIGYRLWRLQSRPGTYNPVVELQDVSRSEAISYQRLPPPSRGFGIRADG